MNDQLHLTNNVHEENRCLVMVPRQLSNCLESLLLVVERHELNDVPWEDATQHLELPL